MAQNHFILGTAGHVDHGKSSLVRALTGVDPDRLAEEKRRGITIELGFAQLPLPNGMIAGLIDVPGHERFVTHMVEGASGIDVALLVVAADDGVMVQTREHLAILQLLGVNSLVVAVTKIDAVEADLTELAVLDVSELLAETPYADAAIVPVSAHAKQGLDALLKAIEDAAVQLSRSAATDLVRLPIDRVFSIAGVGTVITGTLWDGSIEVEDQLQVLRAARATKASDTNRGKAKDSAGTVRVRGIQVHGQQRKRARSGQRVALNLGGVRREDLQRGDMLCTPNSLAVSSRSVARLQFVGSPDGVGAAEQLLKNDSVLTLHHGTQSTPARIKLLFADERIAGIAPGDSAYVQLRLDKALPLRFEDRFIVRSMSPAITVGGGKIILSQASQRTKLDSRWFDFFDLLDGGQYEQAIISYVSAQELPFNSQELGFVLGMSTSLVAQSLNQSDLARLKMAGAGAKSETIYLSASTLAQAKSSCEEALLNFHESSPQSSGISVAALRDIVFMQPRSQQAWTVERFEALLMTLSEAKTIRLSGGMVSHPESVSSVLEQQKAAANNLLIAIKSQGLVVQTPAQLADTIGQPKGLTAQVLGQLTKEGKLLRLAGEFHFMPEHVQDAMDVLRQNLECYQPRGMTAAEIRDLWQISRKYAIPLLEYADSCGVTRRDGDLRYLK